ncbi:MAG: ribonuclease P protein component [Elusimicrobia bacterium]|nr:ribonuclease P protein component [Elusimicrobiota bacterium]
MPAEGKAEKHYRHKNILQNRFFKCRAERNPQNRGRLFLRISKKYARTAVGRNRIKRWIRAIYAKSGVKGKFDIVINLKREPAGEFKPFEENLKDLFGKIGP